MSKSSGALERELERARMKADVREGSLLDKLAAVIGTRSSTLPTSEDMTASEACVENGITMNLKKLRTRSFAASGFSSIMVGSVLW
mmetsp:Transcript_73393/g.153145  ORF Transcript_73393/g.153145 Transcript_73393/m.153145 type:complete len:86 (+) Transcript_73393:272-529(+)